MSDSQQGTVQGALYGAKSLAQGLGPLLFGPLFKWSLGAAHYVPGLVLLCGSGMMLVAFLMAVYLPVEADGETNREDAAAGGGGGRRGRGCALRSLMFWRCGGGRGGDDSELRSPAAAGGAGAPLLE